MVVAFAARPALLGGTTRWGWWLACRWLLASKLAVTLTASPGLPSVPPTSMLPAGTEALYSPSLATPSVTTVSFPKLTSCTASVGAQWRSHRRGAEGSSPTSRREVFGVTTTVTPNRVSPTAAHLAAAPAFHAVRPEKARTTHQVAHQIERRGGVAGTPRLPRLTTWDAPAAMVPLRLPAASSVSPAGSGGKSKLGAVEADAGECRTSSVPVLVQRHGLRARLAAAAILGAPNATDGGVITNASAAGPAVGARGQITAHRHVFGHVPGIGSRCSHSEEAPMMARAMCCCSSPSTSSEDAARDRSGVIRRYHTNKQRPRAAPSNERHGASLQSKKNAGTAEDSASVAVNLAGC